MQKSCAFCGVPFEAKRAAAKYHDATCRQRAKRAGASVATLIPVPDLSLEDDAPLVLATRTTLTKAGVLDTVPGQSALILASKVAAGHDTGSAIAAMVKQLEASVSAALASVTRADKMDEVQKRRDEKLRAAGAS